MLSDSMLFYLLSFLSGFLIKSVDWIEDELKGSLIVKWPLALISGLLIGFVISGSDFSNIFLAAIVAQVLTGKVDKATHGLAIAVAAVVFLLLGINGLKLEHFAIFIIPAAIDELKFTGTYAFLTLYRVFLKAVAFLFVFAGMPQYFIGIIMFDAGYILFKFAQDKIASHVSQ